MFYNNIIVLLISSVIRTLWCSSSCTDIWYVCLIVQWFQWKCPTVMHWTALIMWLWHHTHLCFQAAKIVPQMICFLMKSLFSISCGVILHTQKSKECKYIKSEKVFTTQPTLAKYLFTVMYSVHCIQNRNSIVHHCCSSETSYVVIFIFWHHYY